MYQSFTSSIEKIPPLIAYEETGNAHIENEQSHGETRRERLVDSRNVG